MNDKNNKPLKQFRKLIKQDTEHSLPDIAEDSKSEEEVIAKEKATQLDLINEDIKEIQSAREERKKYANKTFRFLCIYIGIVIGVVVVGSLVVGSLDAVRYDKDFLESIPLTILIGTIPASMALFGWVLKGLFPIDKNK